MERQDLIRAVAFDYVDQLSDHGERPVAWSDLIGFRFEGQRVPLVSQQGIFKPAALDLPISIRTTYRAPGEDRPYYDEVDENSYLLYRYRGTDPQHHENRWLRQVRDRALPLLYLAGVATGRYLPSSAARDVLEETDGPMLRHGLQEVHGRRLSLPRAPEKRPSVEGLGRRWERFRARMG